MRRILIITGLASLAACATGKDPELTQDELEDAVMAPAADLNLRRADIPKVLRDLDSPYAPIIASDCAALANAIVELTGVLGPDDDALVEGDEKNSDKLRKEAADLTLSTVEDASTGFIPFRSLVRRASGASAYEKKLRAAYQRGILRRAYLKGRGEELGCPPPASPHRS